jgi:hypothetical protein
MYNLFLSVFGASAIFAFLLTTAEADQTLGEIAQRTLRIAWITGSILVMSGGQVLALVAMRLFHGREMPYYRSAGIGEGVLAAGSWVLALLVAIVLMIAGMIWT